jgi:hypothetical protein
MATQKQSTENYEKLERDSNQHSLDVKMFIFLQYISPYEKGIFRQ